MGWLHEICYLMGKEWIFDSGRCKSIKVDFSGGGNEYIFGCWVGFCHTPSVSHKGSVKEGGLSTPGGCNKATSKEGTFLVRREIPGV